MQSLFRSNNAETSALNFLNKHAGFVSLVSAPGFFQGIYRQHPDLSPDEVLTCETLSFDEVSMDVLRQRVAQGGMQKTYVVADKVNEPERLRRLRSKFPELTFAGLGETVFPALIARNDRSVFSDQSRELHCHSVVLVFATPRSGSSLVADILADLGWGNVREHLRQTELEVLSSPYNFDRSVALRSLINAVSKDGHFGTKIISHFFVDYLMNIRDFSPLKIFGPDVKVKAIVLDRSGKVDQAASGELAAQRGIWHIQSGKDAEKVASKGESRFNFGRMNARYFRYRQESFILNFAREMFPDHLALDYDADLADGDVEQIGKKIADFLGIDVDLERFKKSEARQKIANEENARFAKQFREEYDAIFGYIPK